jgi:hypothetical protein
VACVFEGVVPAAQRLRRVFLGAAVAARTCCVVHHLPLTPPDIHTQVDFLQQELNMELQDLLAHPTYLGASLMQVCVCVCVCVCVERVAVPELTRAPQRIQTQRARVTMRFSMSCTACCAQVIGPRHAFAIAKGCEAKLTAAGAACSSSRIRQVREHALCASGRCWRWPCHPGARVLRRVMHAAVPTAHPSASPCCGAHAGRRRVGLGPEPVGGGG